jgi:hypothetical protein
MTELSVDVICAYPVSEIYNVQHRAVYYTALAFLVLLPVHRWLTSAALSLVVIYSFATTFYVVGLFLIPSRLGPTLDVYPISSILLVNTYAIATVVFCKPTSIKGKRRWAMVTRLFIWLWGGFMLSNFVKSSFEKKLTSSLTAVDCHSGTSSTLGNVFSAGQGLSCHNPCSAQHAAVVWGTLDGLEFSAYPRPSLSAYEYLVVIAFGIALSLTLWVNFFTSPQTTRNTVFAIFTRSRRDARGIRSALAKMTALIWFTWSYVALGLVALALPFVAYVQEELLKRYPVANTMCLVKQYLPWAIGIVIALFKVAAVRRKRQEAVKLRAERRTRLSNALATLRLQVEQMDEPEHQSSGPVSRSTNSPPSADKSEAPKTYKIEITKVRKINGFLDHFVELREWWANPAGLEEVHDSPPSVDEEKALLKDHYEQKE